MLSHIGMHFNCANPFVQTTGCTSDHRTSSTSEIRSIWRPPSNSSCTCPCVSSWITALPKQALARPLNTSSLKTTGKEIKRERENESHCTVGELSLSVILGMFVSTLRCFVDAKLTGSSSTFLPRINDFTLRFQLEAFRLQGSSEGVVKENISWGPSSFFS